MKLANDFRGYFINDNELWERFVLMFAGDTGNVYKFARDAENARHRFFLAFVFKSKTVID
jgi:hypothetical protein